MKLASALLSLAALASAASKDDKFESDAVQADADAPTANLKVKVSTAFEHSEIFGVKLVNGHSTTAAVSVENNEPGAVTLQLLGGALWTPDYGSAGDAPKPQIVRNLTSTSLRATIPAGEKESFNYAFKLDMHPADLVLKLAAIVSTPEGGFFTLPAFEGNVSVVEAPQSIFDPKLIFLYLILAAGFLGTAYFVYSTWITTLFPAQQKRVPPRVPVGAKAGARAPKSPATPVTGGLSRSPEEIAAQVSGSKVYDESWIPAQHLKRPGSAKAKKTS